MRVCRQWQDKLHSSNCWRSIIVPDVDDDLEDSPLESDEDQSQNKEQPDRRTPYTVSFLTLQRLTSFRMNSVQDVRLGRERMSSLDIMLSVRELVETNSCSLSTLAICLDTSGGGDDEGAIDAACTIIEGKEMSEILRPAVRRDRLLMDLLFNQRDCDDINASRCTNLRELLIQSSTSGIVSCGKTLPSCLKTLILDEFECDLSHEGLQFNLRTSLTKLVIRCGGICVAVSFVSIHS